MIEQRENQLLISFPSAEAAARAKQWMEAAVVPWLPVISRLETGTSSPPSEPSPEAPPSSPAEPFSPLTPPRSRHTVLTEERQAAISLQREAGQTSHQRLLRAQTTLRDGVLPFSRPGQTPPQPTGQPSPRQRAAKEGGFADGSGAQPEAERRGSRLRPVPPSQPSPER